MTTPNVRMDIAPGNQLQGSPASGFDNTFMIVAPASRALPNVVLPLSNPNAIASLAGYGFGPEVCAQCLDAGAGQVYLVAGNKSVVDDDTYDYGVSSIITKGRTASPTLTAVALVGLPELPLQPTFSNTGFGKVYFNADTTPQIASDVALVSVQITTAGALGTAVATIVVGTTTYEDVTLTSSPWTQPYGAIVTTVATGTGTLSTFTPTVGPSWSVNAYTDDIFVDAAGTVFTIVSNSSTALTVVGTPASGVPLGIFSSVSGSAVILDFSLPLTKQFDSGDFFEALPTPNDSYNVRVVITSINSQGQALFQFSLDGGITPSGSISVNLGGVINASTGAPAAVWGSGATFPDSTENVTLRCTQSGTLVGVSTQCSVSTGRMTLTGSGTATATVTTPISSTPGVAGIVTATLTITHSGTTTGTGSGDGTSSSPAGGGTGGGGAGATLVLTDSVGGTRTYTFVNAANDLVGVFTESSTGLVFTFASAGFINGDVYVIQISPPALFSKIINGSTTTGVTLPNTGLLAGLNGPKLQFPTGTGTSASAWEVAQSYQFWAYPQASYQPTERDGQLNGFQFSFGFGVYAAGDTYVFPCAGPFVSNTDALNALSVILGSQAYLYSMVQFYTGVRDEVDGNLVTNWDTAINLATSVNTQLIAAEASPKFLYKSGLICGPDAAATIDGATPNDYIAALGSAELDSVMTSAGTDLIVSVLTGRQDLRNHGVADIARLASPSRCPVQTDPGEFAQGVLRNVVDTTTSVDDANTFNANRAMVAVKFEGVTGVREAEGLTLAAPGGDYSTVMNVRVIDKVAYYGRLALLPYGVNRRVPTVSGTGTLSPKFATLLENDVSSRVDRNCPGNYQTLTVTASLTDVLIPKGTEHVNLAIRPWGYVRDIIAPIGFTR